MKLGHEKNIQIKVDLHLPISKILKYVLFTKNVIRYHVILTQSKYNKILQILEQFFPAVVSIFRKFHKIGFSQGILR